MSAGFDIHDDDPLDDMRVSSRGFGLLTSMLIEAARESCPGRLAFVLEGGYDLRALQEGTASVLTALVKGEQARPVIDGPMNAETALALDSALSALGSFWKLP